MIFLIIGYVFVGAIWHKRKVQAHPKHATRKIPRAKVEQVEKVLTIPEQFAKNESIPIPRSEPINEERLLLLENFIFESEKEEPEPIPAEEDLEEAPSSESKTGAEEIVSEERIEPSKDILICPECGEFVDETFDSCPGCGVKFIFDTPDAGNEIIEDDSEKNKESEAEEE